MGKSPIAARLVAPPGLALGAAPGLAGAAGGTVHLATITMAADQHVSAAAAAQKKARRHPVSRAGAVGVAWTQRPLSATVSLHACPARCRARRRWKLGGLGSAPCLPATIGKVLPRRQPSRHPEDGVKHDENQGSRESGAADHPGQSLVGAPPLPATGSDGQPDRQPRPSLDRRTARYAGTSPFIRGSWPPFTGGLTRCPARRSLEPYRSRSSLTSVQHSHGLNANFSTLISPV